MHYSSLPLIGNSSLGNLSFSMVLEFHELEFYEKILKFFNGIRGT